MLKIKDNVNLEELDNYGFEHDIEYFWKNHYGCKCLLVDIETKIITNYGDKTGNDILYELIIDGLVERAYE